MNKTPIVWQMLIDEHNRGFTISGIFISYREFSNENRSVFQEIISSYFIKPFAGKSVEIQFGGQNIKVETNEYGEIEIEESLKSVSDIKFFYKNTELKILQNYPINHKNTDSDIGVISDLDDTAIISNTLNILKRLRKILFVRTEKREIVNFTKEFLIFLKKKDAKIYYVSKSEKNLFPLLSGILLKNDFPIGGIRLTPFLRYSQLLNPKKGKSFKENEIQNILQLHSNRRFVLFGDDTQRDADVYLFIVKNNPERIIKVFIRKTRTIELKRTLKCIDEIKQRGVPVLYFTDLDNVKNEIQLLNSLL